MNDTNSNKWSQINVTKANQKKWSYFNRMKLNGAKIIKKKAKSNWIICNSPAFFVVVGRSVTTIYEIGGIFLHVNRLSYY